MMLVQSSGMGDDFSFKIEKRKIEDYTMSSQVLTRCKHSDAKAKSSKAKMQHKVIIFNFPV